MEDADFGGHPRRGALHAAISEGPQSTLMSRVGGCQTASAGCRTTLLVQLGLEDCERSLLFAPHPARADLASGDRAGITYKLRLARFFGVKILAAGVLVFLGR